MPELGICDQKNSSGPHVCSLLAPHAKLEGKSLWCQGKPGESDHFGSREEAGPRPREEQRALLLRAWQAMNQQGQQHQEATQKCSLGLIPVLLKHYLYFNKIPKWLVCKLKCEKYTLDNKGSWEVQNTSSKPELLHRKDAQSGGKQKRTSKLARPWFKSRVDHLLVEHSSAGHSSSESQQGCEV